MIELLGSYNSAAGADLSAAQAVVIEIVVIGIVATMATDLWQMLLRAALGVPSPNWGLVGRWVAWLPRGVIVHRPIAATPPIRGELAIGWAFHYAVGLVYAALYVAVTRALGSGLTLTSALVLAVVLLVAPWCVMQPALGLGFMAARAPHPYAVRAINISVHAVFGIGLYLGAMAMPVGIL